jgi:hypothetical protein
MTAYLRATSRSVRHTIDSLTSSTIDRPDLRKRCSQMSMGRSHSPTPARDRAGPTRGTAVDCSASASGGMAPAAPTCGGTVDINDIGGWPLLSRPSDPDSLAATPSIECGIASQQPKAQRHRRCSGHADSIRRHVGRRYAVNVMHAVTKSIECSSRTLWNAGRLLSAPFSNLLSVLHGLLAGVHKILKIPC